MTTKGRDTGDGINDDAVFELLASACARMGEASDLHHSGLASDIRPCILDNHCDDMQNFWSPYDPKKGL